MSRKFIVLLMVVSMVVGIFGLTAAQNAGGPPEGIPTGPPVQNDEEDRGDVSGEVQSILDDFKVPVAEHVYGPPEFVSELRAIGYHFMDRSKVQVNGEAMVSGLPPVNAKGRILIPARDVSQALGAVVDWDANGRKVTITKDDVNVELIIDEAIFTVNGKAKELDVPAQILGGSTFVPLRFAAEALGEAVDWDADTATAFIGAKGKGPLGE